MNLVDPDKLRLMPGQSLQAAFSEQPGGPGEVGFFIRSLLPIDRRDGTPSIRKKAGLISFNDVLLVLTMIQVETDRAQLFDLWWNYCSPKEQGLFQTMSQQDNLTVYFYGSDGKYSTVNTENSFRRFFSSLPEVFEKSNPWNEAAFDRAVRGFCAQAYPLENLWDLIQTKVNVVTADEKRSMHLNDYPGFIPDELRPFYDYTPTQGGHCIRIIPSIFESNAMEGNPEEFLFPAPVKTVLRCAVRWAKGYPVAPIPFIPGHGLAVPPDDVEY